MVLTMVQGWSRCPLQCQPRLHCQWNLLRATCYCRIHHHSGNYADLPLLDILFGTFHNPLKFADETGFYDGASARIQDMLMFRDVSNPR